ncbi:sigma-70 family RNA polymerase sigma factor [Microbacterium paraoxydans]|uniref:RNA polymerase sigma factor, sigma-70 family n=2 Tax=Microbacterium paraoxydans TaxID=199592 RepID=A0A1H1TCW1_9MICO|nr:sigma-70 family RNA polymerase sigma factor [Microbacterium paraoxydans]SDS57891.1 RNA polymerase sigma factor, sigma-70 family [Microbacterium paraoxydans]
MSDERRDEDRERDADLLGRVRGGDEQAYAELWERYAPAAAAVARSYWWSADADDLVAESFTRIYQAIQAGKGPTAAFKPYLFATMRNLAISWGRARREVPIEYIEAVEDPNSTDAAADADFDASLVSQAILALPERWQDVLWFGEVEHLSMHEIGKRLDISERAAAVLAFRAREGLRQAWITAHVAARPPASRECQWTMGKLGAHARQRLTSRDTARVHAHLDECADCRAKADEARHASSRMLSVLFPAGIAVGAGAQIWQSLTSAGLSASAAPLPPAIAAPVAGIAAAKATVAIVTAVAATTLAATVVATVVGGTAVVATPAASQVVTWSVPTPTASPSAAPAPVATPAETTEPPGESEPPAPAEPPADPDPEPAPDPVPEATVPSPPVLISVPGQVSRTKLLSVTVACEAGADLTVSAYGATLAAGTCAANERWQASFEVDAYPVPAGTAVTLSFAQSNIAGVSGAATAEVVIVD